MSYLIKFLHLQKSELQYEVTIRGEVPAHTVLELRRQVCRLTQLYPSNDIVDSCLEWSDDMKGISDTLNKIKANLDNLSLEMDESLMDRTRSLLNHLFHRIRRLEQPDTSESITKLKLIKNTYDEYTNLFSSLVEPEDKFKDSVCAPLEVRKSTLGADKLNVTVHCDRGLSADIAKLKFDGKTCVRSFIQKLKEFRLAKNVSDEKMMTFAYEIFTGDALHWFRSVKDDIKNPEDLIMRLQQDFDVFDYDYRMITEIRNRTQGELENIIVYMAIMRGMFSRLSNPLTEKDQLEILLHNIRPCYSNVLANCPDVSSILQLQTLCRNYEQVKARSENFREPIASTSKTLAPEFSYTTPNKNYNNFKPYPNSINKTSTNNKVFAISQPKFCYRCRVDTHSMRECTADRVIFCFKCGKKDVRSTECPVCNNNQTDSGKKNE